MDRIRVCPLAVVIALAGTCALGGATAQAIEIPEDFDVLVKQALLTAALTPADIVLKTDYALRDGFRLDVAETLLAEPLTIPRWTETTADRVARATRLAALMDVLAEAKDLDVGGVSFAPNAQPDWTLCDALGVLARAEGAEFKVRRRQLDAQLRPLPRPIVEALTVLVEGAAAARLSSAGAYGELSDDDRAFLLANIQKIATEGESTTPEETDRLFGLVKQVDQQRLAEGAKVLCATVDCARDVLAAHRAEIGEWVRTAPLDAPVRIATPLGEIVIGTPGDDVHRDGAFILIEPAGNDVYLEAAGASSSRLNGIGIAIDLAGDDQYIAREPFAFGAAKCGFGILVDETGDDGYSGAHNCLGRGLLGLGLLVEAEGLDRYDADTASQAAAHFGFGVLVDEAGNDHYTAHLNSQGHAGVNGVAMLIDTQGNDVYVAGAKYPDYREAQRHYGSLSQGFSIGWRPLYSGGFGALFDFGGDDVYISDYFAQGSSYWYGVGLLYDDAGDDRYIARRYSQGAATHLCVGILADSAG
ncbi:MAG: hypothetical protein JW889_03885, partial [Verrucomicrobia bacterium]|nr:hypothetical protein [Verrucomicrobiota bacterium]